MRFCKTEKQQLNNGKWRRSALLLAMSSAISILFTHPLDVVRVQMQSQLVYVSPRQVLKNIYKYRGLNGIYYGLMSAVQREFFYCLLRFSFYEKARSSGLVQNFRQKLRYSSASGLFAGVVMTPLTKVAVRIRTDAARPPFLRYSYHNLFQGLWKLYREGGLKNFYYMWRTCALRGTLITVSQLSVYHQVKEAFSKNNVQFRYDWESYFLASAIAGGVTALVLTPIDLVENIGHNTIAKKFCGEWNIVQRLNRFYGWPGFYRGLYANFLRSPPQTIMTFLIYEKLHTLFYNRFET